MADTYNIVRPLTARHIIGTSLYGMSPDSYTVPLPHGYVQMFEKTSRDIGLDGPFAEMLARLKPLLAEYPRQRFYGVVSGIEPDGNDETDNDNVKNGENKNETSNNTGSDVDGKRADTDSETQIVYQGTWYWVSLVPYRIFEAFCMQHIHDWWYRYNLTRNTLEFVMFDNNGNAKEIITMQTLPDGAAQNIDAWNADDSG